MRRRLTEAKMTGEVARDAYGSGSETPTRANLGVGRETPYDVRPDEF